MHTPALLTAAVLAVPGLLLLVAGTRIYGTVVRLIGFVIGASLAATAVVGVGLTESAVGLAASVFLVILTGVIAAFLAMAFHDLFVIGLGFIGGAVIAVALLQTTGIPASPTGAFAGGAATQADLVGIVALLIGGLLGAGLGWFLFRAIVILVTAVLGAGLLTAGEAIATHAPGDPVTLQEITAQPALLLQDGLLFPVLVLLGILVQGIWALRTRRTEEEDAARRRKRERDRRRRRR